MKKVKQKRVFSPTFILIAIFGIIIVGAFIYGGSFGWFKSEIIEQKNSESPSDLEQIDSDTKNNTNAIQENKKNDNIPDSGNEVTDEDSNTAVNEEPIIINLLNDEIINGLTCVDSDGGFNLILQGSVSGTNSTNESYFYADSCINNSFLNEYLCSGTDVVKSINFCEGVCLEGKCTTTCLDTDAFDGGGNPTGGIFPTSGAICIENNDGANPLSYTDSCRNTKTANEYYCDTQNKCTYQASPCPTDAPICFNDECTECLLYCPTIGLGLGNGLGATTEECSAFTSNPENGVTNSFYSSPCCCYNN